ncbi:uncharacterized protein LOC141908075 isoform X2 [Tubulanus polymorphus]
MSLPSRLKFLMIVAITILVVCLYRDHRSRHHQTKNTIVARTIKPTKTSVKQKTPVKQNVNPPRAEIELNAEWMYEIPATGEKKRMHVHKPQPGFLVPNVMHYTWYDDRPNRMNFRFHHMLSLLSAYKNNKPEALYLWYETMPRGPIWARTLKLIPNVRPVHRPGPTSIYGNSIRVQEHKSDVVRLEAVLAYGGIYTDLDVIVLKSMDPLRKFPMTMGLEEPMMLCNGIIISAPQAEFLKIWHNEYKNFSDAQWAVHSVVVPAQLAKKYPQLIQIERNSLHRPNWRPEERKLMYNPGSNYDYSKNYAVHLYYRWHNIEHNDNDIKLINSTMGRIFRQTLYGSPNLIPN